MKSYGPKALLDVQGETLISRQIRLLRECFSAEITVVAGFEADRVRRALPDDIQIVRNDNYSTTNVASSVAMGLGSTNARAVLVVYGDLVFTRGTFQGLDTKQSSLLVHNDIFRNEEVGVNAIEGKAMYLSFGLPLKWAHIMLLREREQLLFMDAARAPDRKRHFSYEILNTVIEQGGSFEVVTKTTKLVEVDCSKDIDRARQIDAESLDLLQSAVS